MRSNSRLMFRLFLVLAMALGLTTLIGPSATAAQDIGACQIVGGDSDPAQDVDCELNYDAEADTCELVIDGESFDGGDACAAIAAGECPYQAILDDGTIVQIQCAGGEPTAEPTDEPTAEPTDEPTAEPTDEPTAEPTDEPDNGGEAEEPVDELPATGVGSNNGQSDLASTSLLGMLSVLMMLGAALIWQRREA